MITIGLEQIGIGWHWKGPGWTFEQLKEYYIEAEQLGYDNVWLSDNIVHYDNVTHEPMPTFECWTLLGALAAVTKKIRIGSMVTPARRRHPALLAKMAITVDQISEGRLNLGIGPGDHESHLWLWGMEDMSPRERIDYLREEVEIIKLLCGAEGNEVSFNGKYYRLNKAPVAHKPIQTPHPPIWTGLILGKKVMARWAAEFADGIDIYNASDVAAKELLDSVEKNCNDLGRDFDSITKSRSVFVVFTDGKEDLPFIDMDVSLSIDEQRKRVREANNPDLEYEKITRRYVVGTPEKVAEELCAISDIGFSHLRFIFLDSLELIELFAKEVMPIIKTH